MLEPINRKAPEDRRSVPLDPAAPPTVLQGSVLQTDGTANGYAVLADGSALVPDPMWAFTKSSRLDVQEANAVSVLEAPFVAEVDTDGYDGSPAAGAALAIGTGGTVGKLVVVTVTTVADLQSVVAYCLRAADADGKIRIKAIR